MIKYVKGDLTDTHCSIIAHGCNAQGVMNSGVARAIRDKWPNVYREYRSHYDHWGLTLGSVLYCSDSHRKYHKSDNKIIANMITQFIFGANGRRYVNYGAVARCLEDLVRKARNTNVSEVAMPKIGCGLGGGDWEVVSELIEFAFAGTGITVLVYEL